MIHWLVLFLVSFTVFVSAQKSCPAKLITSLHQKNCTDKATEDTAYFLDSSSCIPKCTMYTTGVEPGSCSMEQNDTCNAGYTCNQRCYPSNQYSCEVTSDCPGRETCTYQCVSPYNETVGVPCMAYHSNMAAYVSTWWTAKKFKPSCDDDGNWNAKQCKGGLPGRCLCYSSTGTRLFGQALYVDSENMTCSCSRRKSELEDAGRNFVSFHCDSMGNFESLQCDQEKALCWCVDSITGDVTAPFIPAAAMTKLPCYTESKIGFQYLRQCESMKFAKAMITAKLKARGVQVVEPDMLLCDADGSYGAYSISSGIAYCTWRDNSNIGTWQTNIGGMKNKLTCNCARDFKMYSHSLSCESTGNYDLLQKVIDEKGNQQYYCVDDDGFAKSDMLDDSTTNCTALY